MSIVKLPIDIRRISSIIYLEEEMTKQINENTWQCMYCKKQYQNVLMADACEKSHKMILVPLSREDLNRLIQYLYTGEQKLLTESLMTTLLNYSRFKDYSDGVSDM